VNLSACAVRFDGCDVCVHDVAGIKADADDRAYAVIHAISILLGHGLVIALNSIRPSIVVTIQKFSRKKSKAFFYGACPWRIDTVAVSNAM
jgi:hypothetical protein